MLLRTIIRTYTLLTYHYTSASPWQPLQLCHYYRLLHVEGAVRRHYCRIRATDPKSQVTLNDIRGMVGRFTRGDGDVGGVGWMTV